MLLSVDDAIILSKLSKLTAEAVLYSSIFIKVDLIHLLHDLVASIDKDMPWVTVGYSFDYRDRPNSDLMRRTLDVLAYYDVGFYRQYRQRQSNEPALPKRIRLNLRVGNELTEALYNRLVTLGA